MVPSSGRTGSEYSVVGVIVDLGALVAVAMSGWTLTLPPDAPSLWLGDHLG